MTDWPSVALRLTCFEKVFLRKRSHRRTERGGVECECNSFLRGQRRSLIFELELNEQKKRQQTHLEFASFARRAAGELLSELMPIFESLRARESLPCAFPLNVGQQGHSPHTCRVFIFWKKKKLKKNERNTNICFSFSKNLIN